MPAARLPQMLQQQIPTRRGRGKPNPIVTRRPRPRPKGHRGSRGGHRLGGSSR